jgi:hypothetical protein
MQYYQTELRSTEAIKMKTVYSVLLMGVLVLSGAGVVLAWPWDPLEERLLEALKDRNLGRFEKLLKKGASPNAILGTEPHEWVMCLATDKGNEAFLKLAVEYGGDVDLRHSKRTDSSSAPILCAIYFHNYNSFDFLIKKGVDIDIKVNPLAKKYEKSIHVKQELWGKIFYGSPLVVATYFNQYRMIYAIIQRKKLNEEELWTLKYDIEKGAIDLNSDHNKWRMKVVELLRQQGHEVTPWPGKGDSVR